MVSIVKVSGSKGRDQVVTLRLWFSLSLFSGTKYDRTYLLTAIVLKPGGSSTSSI